MRTRSRPRTRRASLRARLVSTMPTRFAYLGMCARITFSKTDRVGTTPLSRRSSVSSAMPSRLASMGERMVSSCPFTRIVPDAIVRRPKIASTSSVRCAPTSPPIPRTSPRCSRNEMSRKEPGTGDVSAFDLEQHLPRRRVATRVAVGQLAADHPRDDLADRQRRRRPRPDHPPVAHDRDLVGDRHDLFELVRDVDDRDAIRRAGRR